MNRKKWRGLCTQCGIDEIGKSATKYCSRRCEHAAKFKKLLALVESGNYPAVQTGGFLKKYLAAIFGERCAQCGWAQRHPVTGSVPVEVEHIDGNWQNNHPANLTLLCPNCHSLTATYRGLNRGKGRPRRIGGRENPLNPKG